MKHYLLIRVENDHSETGLIAVDMEYLIPEAYRLCLLIRRCSLTEVRADWSGEAVPEAYLPWDPDDNADDSAAATFDDNGWLVIHKPLPRYDEIAWPSDDPDVRFRLTGLEIKATSFNGFTFVARRKHDDTEYEGPNFGLSEFEDLVENLPAVAAD